MRRGIAVIIALGLVSTVLLLVFLGSLSKEVARRGGIRSSREKVLQQHLLQAFPGRLLRLTTARIHAEQGLVVIAGQAQQYRDRQLPEEVATRAWLHCAPAVTLKQVKVEIRDPDQEIRSHSLTRAPEMPKSPPRGKPKMDQGKHREGMPGR